MGLELPSRVIRRVSYGFDTPWLNLDQIDKSGRTIRVDEWIQDHDPFKGWEAPPLEACKLDASGASVARMGDGFCLSDAEHGWIFLGDKYAMLVPDSIAGVKGRLVAVLSLIERNTDAWLAT